MSKGRASGLLNLDYQADVGVHEWRLTMWMHIKRFDSVELEISIVFPHGIYNYLSMGMGEGCPNEAEIVHDALVCECYSRD